MNSAESTIRALIQRFDLAPHPEGGFFKETYRSAETLAQPALPSRFGGNRAFSTAIYFLLPKSAVSRFHRISADEVWHFYLGGTLEVIELTPNGPRITRLGQDLARGETVQHVVRAGTWFGARPAPGSEFCFVGCTVAPGFDFADFEMADFTTLSAHYPNDTALIRQLT